MAPLREVGFWCSTTASQAAADDGRPSPLQHVRRGWSRTPEAKLLAEYLSAGYVESYEMGYSFCRFAGQGGEDGRAPCPHGAHSAMGCVALTDGEFVWPEGLRHYVQLHSVVPPGSVGQDLLAKAASAIGREFAEQRQGAFREDATLGTAVATAAALLGWQAGEGAAPLGAEIAALVAVQSPTVAANLALGKHGGRRKGIAQHDAELRAKFDSFRKRPAGEHSWHQWWIVACGITVVAIAAAYAADIAG